MDRAVKQEQIAFVKNLIDSAECLILTSIEGLNASEVSELRASLHKENVGFKVVKNKLAQKALSDTPAEKLSGDFAGSTAIAWSDDNPVTPAKILVKYEKEFEKLTIKSGFNSDARIDFDGIKALSKLPSLDELRSQMLGLFTAPAARLLAQINAPASHIVGVMQARIDKEKDA